jgi:hypothetical protein
MAQRGTKNEPKTPPETIETGDDFTPEDIAVMQMLEELGSESEAVVRIYRQGKTYRDITLLHECSPQDFTPIMLSHPPFNGGEFRIHIQAKGGMAGNRLLKVAAAVDAATPGAQPAQQPQGDLITAMMAGFDKLGQLIVQQQKPAVDPMEMIGKVADILAKTQRPVVQEAGGGMRETIALMSSLMDITEKMRGPASVINADGELSSGALLYKGFEKFLEIVKEAKTMQPQPGAVQVPQPQQIEALVEEIILPTGEKVMVNAEQKAQLNSHLEMIKMALGAGNLRAQANADAKAYAETIYDQIPEEFIDMMATSKDWFAMLLRIEPGCAPHQVWYGKVREALMDFAVEDGLLTRDAHGVLTVTPEPGNLGANDNTSTQTPTTIS